MDTGVSTASAEAFETWTGAARELRDRLTRTL